MLNWAYIVKMSLLVTMLLAPLLILLSKNVRKEMPESIKLVSLFIGLLGGCVLLAFQILTFTLEVKYIELWDSQVSYYRNLEHPTRQDCIDAEDYNRLLLKCTYFDKAYIKSLPKIDSEELWKRFNKNTNANMHQIEQENLTP